MLNTRKLKWSIAGGLALLLITSLLFASCAPATPEPEAEQQVVPVSEPIYKWRLQTGDYPEDVATERWKIFADQVKTMTGGRVEITTYVAGAVIGSFETFDAVAEGTIELGGTYTFYMGGKVPAANLQYTIPFVLGTGSGDYLEAYWMMEHTDWQPILRAEYAKHNVHLISSDRWFWPYGNFMSTKPVRGLEDIKGLKLRAGGVLGKLYEALGASVTLLPKEELYTALSTGTIDACVWGAPHAFYDNNFHEVAKYYSQPPLQTYGQLDFIINPDLWEQLPDDIKLILDYAVYEMCFSCGRIGNYKDAGAIQAMQQAGVEFITLPEEDVAYMKKLAWDEIYPELAAVDAPSAAVVTILEEVAEHFGNK